MTLVEHNYLPRHAPPEVSGKLPLHRRMTADAQTSEFHEVMLLKLMEFQQAESAIGNDTSESHARLWRHGKSKDGESGTLEIADQKDQLSLQSAILKRIEKKSSNIDASNAFQPAIFASDPYRPLSESGLIRAPSLVAVPQPAMSSNQAKSSAVAVALVALASGISVTITTGATPLTERQGLETAMRTMLAAFGYESSKLQVRYRSPNPQNKKR